MKDSLEAKLAASVEDVYCQSSLNEHENHRSRGKTACLCGVRLQYQI